MKSLVLAIAMVFPVIAHAEQGVRQGSVPPQSLPVNAAHGVAKEPQRTDSGIVVENIEYRGVLHDDRAEFAVRVELTVIRPHASLTLFDGHVAVQAKKLPSDVSQTREGNSYRIICSKRGRKRLEFSVLAGSETADSWRRVAFAGPSDALVASFDVETADKGVEARMESGIPVESGERSGRSFVTGLLGADGVIAVRWGSRVREEAKQTLLACNTACSVTLSPTVARYSTIFTYEVLLGSAARVEIELPKGHSLTRIAGPEVRDWQTQVEGDRHVLVVELIGRGGREIQVALHTEHPVDTAAGEISLSVPAPVGVEREVGTFAVFAEDLILDPVESSGLRQINAPKGAVAAYQFHGRPLCLKTSARRVEPSLKVTDNVSVSIEESRAAVCHEMAIVVEKAGIYGLEMKPISPFVVADVHADGMEDWRVSADALRISFAKRVLGQAVVMVEMERPAGITNELRIIPLRVSGASEENAFVGVLPAAGLRLKTGERNGAREIPVESMKSRGSFALAYASEKPDWGLALLIERLEPRILAEVFNLVSIGEGIVGGSATIRYALLNQGVSGLSVRIPDHWKNVEFTGAGIRQIAASNGVWAITLQDKVWGGYTLVVTYDFPFDMSGAAPLVLGGAEVLGVERETGSLAICPSPALSLSEALVSAAQGAHMFRIDETELAVTDRALISRPVFLAYRYSGSGCRVDVRAVRFPQAPVLQAVVDLTDLTTVLTQEGQLLTRASYMVKNNDKQFVRFRLPEGADFWACSSGGKPAKPAVDGGEVLVPLCREANRDQAVPVQIVYAQKAGRADVRLLRRVRLAAPATDIQTSFARWHVHVPPTHVLAFFGGNMKVAEDTRYGLRDAWKEFCRFYDRLYLSFRGVIVGLGVLTGSVWLLIMALRRKWRAVLVLLVVGFVLMILAGMLLPAMSAARESTRRIRVESHKPAAPSSQVADVLAETAAQSEPEEFSHEKEIGTPEARLKAPAGAAVEAGIVSMNIDVPQTGMSYEFAKVLDMRRDGLRVSAWAVKGVALTAAQGSLILAVFLVGLCLAWRYLRSDRQSAFKASIGIFLICAAVVYVLVLSRLMGMAMILLPPLAAVGAAWWLIARARSRRGVVPPAPSVPASLFVAALGFLIADAQVSYAGGGATIVSAEYSGIVQSNVARIAATLNVSIHAMEGAKIDIFGAEAALAGFRSSSRHVRLLREGGKMVLLSDRPTDAVVKVDVVVRVGGDAAARSLVFSAPEAVSAGLSLLIPEQSAQVEIPGAVWKRSAPEYGPKGAAAVAGGTRVEARYGAAGKIEVVWRPRTKQAGEAAAVVFCENNALLTLGEGAVSTRSTARFSVMQGEIAECRFVTPHGHRMLGVEGEGVIAWNMADEAGTNVITAVLSRPVTGSVEIAVQTEAPLASLPAEIDVVIPRPLGVMRETGLIAMAAGEDIGVEVIRDDGVHKIDASEYVAATGGKSAPDRFRLIETRRFMTPEFILRLKLDLLKPQLEASVINHLRIEYDRLLLGARVEYLIKRAGVFGMKMLLPDGFSVAGVKGPEIAQWSEKSEDGHHVLDIRLKEKALGTRVVDVELRRWISSPPDAMDFTGVRPLDVARLTGFVKAGAERGIQVRAASFEGLFETPAISAPDVLPGGGVLSYKLAPDAEAKGWVLRLQTEQAEPWVRGEILNRLLISSSEYGSVVGSSLIRFDVQNAPVKEFLIRFPEELRNVEVKGANIRRCDREKGDVRIEMQSRAMGQIEFSATWDARFDPSTGVVEIKGPNCAEAERETGWIVVSCEPPVETVERSASGEMVRIEEKDLPEWAGRAAGAALAYRYLRPGWELTADARRFESAKVLASLIEQARFSTVVAEDGQTMTEMRLRVRTAGRQHLEMGLPGGAQLWAAFVNGEAVRPSVRDDKFLIPLEKPDEGTAVRIEAVYVGVASFPSRRGRVSLGTPSFDAPIENASWELYLPEDYHYGAFGGSMMYMPEATEASRRFSYSLDEYVGLERQREHERKAEVSLTVEQAKYKLQKKDLERATIAYQRAKGSGAKIPAKGLAELERGIKAAQASNVIEGQQSFVQRNLDQAGRKEQGAGGPPDVQQQPADIEIATRQYERVQQAQELAVIKVGPLHIGLPRSGLRYTFVQPLQTEVARPMTVEFKTVNARSVSAALTVFVSVCGFVVLWVGSGLLLRRGRRADNGAAV